MDTLVRVNADEVNNNLIDFIKTSFKGNKITLNIYEDQTDETAYLLSDLVAKKRLMESAENVRQGLQLKKYTMQE
jgi:hypothetical protein